MSVFSSFPGLARRAQDADIELPPRLVDLAQTFPLLFYMLAGDSGSFARRLDVIRLVESGRSLTDAAAAYRLPMCLRRIPAEACRAALPWVDWSPAVVNQLGNHIPDDPAEAANWLDAVFHAANACNEEFALWISRQRALFPKTPLDARQLMPLSLYAWHSTDPQGPLASINTTPWSPLFGLTRAIEETDAWLIRLHMLSYCGSYPIAETWLEPGPAGGYDFVAIRTYEQLMAERLAMRNCLHTYVDRLISGACRLFAVKSGGRSVATLEIDADAHGQLRIAQLKGPGNVKAADDIHAAAQAWASRQRGRRRPLPRRVSPGQAALRLHEWMHPWRRATATDDDTPTPSAPTLRELLSQLKRHCQSTEKSAAIELRRAAQPPAVVPPLAPLTPAVEFRIRAALRARLGEDIFTSWFNRLTFDGYVGGTVHAHVPVRFLQRWITAHFLEDIRISCSTVWPALNAVELHCRPPVIQEDAQPPPALFDALHGGAAREQPSISIEQILVLVAQRYHLTRIDILSQRRHRQVVRARQIGMYLARQLTSRSLPEIGRRFGNRDHTTVLNAVRRVEHLIEGDPAFRAEMEALRRTAAASIDMRWRQ